MDYSVKQFKLVNGEEIVCEVLEESAQSFAVRNAFVLYEKETTDGYKYFTFRTFMTYQDTPLSVMLLMSDKIMAMAIPSDDMKEQYYVAMDEMAEHIARYIEEEEEAEQPKPKAKPNSNNVMSIQDWVNGSNESLLDSDTDGLIPN